MTWGKPRRSLRRELTYAVAKAVAVTGLFVAGHVGSAVATDIVASSEGRTVIENERPATVTRFFVP